MTVQFDTDALAPLFNPRSIAIIGASARKGRPGFDAVDITNSLGWKGNTFPVTPKYDTIAGWPCFSSMDEITQPVDLAIIAGSIKRIEDDLISAIDHGARSILIFGNPLIVGDPTLGQRIQRLSEEANIPMLGPNSIGYVNYSQQTVASWVPPTVSPCGPIAGIIQSGSLFGVSTLIDPRIRFALTAHPGHECSVSVGDIINYSLSLPQTRVIALYLEIIYEPESFVSALRNATAAGVPVVVLKPGRGEQAQAAINTHTGRMAAADDLIDALLRKHHVLRVENTDEWLTTLCLFSHVTNPGPGGLSLVGDSGGMKALVIDEAEKLGLPLTTLTQASQKKLISLLAPDLAPENPIDFWGGESDIDKHVQSCVEVLCQDPGTAIAVGLGEYGSVDSDEFTNFIEIGVTRAAKSSLVPVVAGSYSSRQFNSKRIERFQKNGIAVLDGIPNILRAVRHCFHFRDRKDNFPQVATLKNDSLLKLALSNPIILDEFKALNILNLAGIDTIKTWPVSNDMELAKVTTELNNNNLWPVAIKTAEGHEHKTELNGVRLNIHCDDELRIAHKDLYDRLGAKAIIQTMSKPGVEIALGIINHPDYGPFMMIATGGTNVELSMDKQFTLCPVSYHEAAEMIENLHCRPLIDGYRNSPALDKSALLECIIKLSNFAWTFRNEIKSIDINPLILHKDGAVAVDTLIERADNLQ